MLDGLDPRSLDDRERDVEDARNIDSSGPRDVFARELDLPRGREREHVRFRDREYHLRGSEVRSLATIGAFRVAPVDDLRDADGRPADLRNGDLQRLRTAGLIRTVAPLDRNSRTTLVALTERGRELLEHHRKEMSDRPHQVFYDRLGRQRELSHDAQFVRAYDRAAERLRKDGARIQRVVIDAELKRDYQRFLQERNRHKPDSDGRPARTREEIKEWARQHQLPVVNDRVQFPDFRIEYELPDGRREIEDVEVTTAHYRGGHASGKVQAGFTRFRGAGGRVGGRSTRGGAAPFDPRFAEELLD
jgi:DNA-binding MarR family transcriptional regulator